MQDNKTIDSSIFEFNKKGEIDGIKQSAWNLQHLEIPEGTVNFKVLNCCNMRNLRSLTLPSSLRELELFYLPKTVKTVINHSPILFGWWTRYHKYNWRTLYSRRKIDLSKYTNSDGKPFTILSEDAFQYSAVNFFEYLLNPTENFRKIDTGSFITKINDYAFRACFFLKYVEIGKNVQSIGHGIFDDCRVLKAKNVINHSPVLFDWWVKNHKYDGKTLSEMETVDLDKYTNSDGKPFTNVSKNVFYGCPKVKNILFGNTIKQINRQSFRGCDKLKNIQINNKDILFVPEAFNSISKSVNFYVRDEQIKEKLQKIGIDSKQIFVKPIPKEELEESKEHKIELTC